MDESIFERIRYMSGVNLDDDLLCQELLAHIMSVIAELGAVVSFPIFVYFITPETTWVECFGEHPQMHLISQYILDSVKIVFDPPQIGALIANLQQRIEKNRWVLSCYDEEGVL